MQSEILTLDEVADMLRLPKGSHRAHRTHSALRVLGVVPFRLSRTQWRVHRVEIIQALARTTALARAGATTAVE